MKWQVELIREYCDGLVFEHMQIKSQSQSQKFLLRKEIYIEYQNILTAIHDQD